MEKICVLIVTYNRKDYLSSLLDRLVSLDYPIDTILIFDNFSSDGTAELLKNKGIIPSYKEKQIVEGKYRNTNILFYKNDVNSGGSGGFHDGMNIAMNYSFDYLWCMDDDVLPEFDCLSRLINVLDKDCLMAIPSRNDDNYNDKPIVSVNLSNPFLFNRIKKAINVTDCVSDVINVVDVAFEGPLISTKLIEKVGPMDKDFFIFYDDSDFSYRASKVTNIKYCKKAVLHKQIIPTNGSNRKYGWRDYYMIRNRIWFDKKNGENIFVKKLRPILYRIALIVKALILRKSYNIKVINKAYKDAIHGKMGKTVDPAKGIII